MTIYSTTPVSTSSGREERYVEFRETAYEFDSYLSTYSGVITHIALAAYNEDDPTHTTPLEMVEDDVLQMLKNMPPTKLPSVLEEIRDRLAIDPSAHPDHWEANFGRFGTGLEFWQRFDILSAVVAQCRQPASEDARVAQVIANRKLGYEQLWTEGWGDRKDVLGSFRLSESHLAELEEAYDAQVAEWGSPPGDDVLAKAEAQIALDAFTRTCKHEEAYIANLRERMRKRTLPGALVAQVGAAQGQYISTAEMAAVEALPERAVWMRTMVQAAHHLRSLHPAALATATLHNAPSVRQQLQEGLREIAIHQEFASYMREHPIPGAFLEQKRFEGAFIPARARYRPLSHELGYAYPEMYQRLHGVFEDRVKGPMLTKVFGKPNGTTWLDTPSNELAHAALGVKQHVGNAALWLMFNEKLLEEYDERWWPT